MWPFLRADLLLIGKSPAGNTESAETFLRIQSETPALRDAMREIQQVQAGAQESLLKKYEVALGLILSLDLALMLGGLWFMKRWILSPVLAMQAGARRVEAGDFGHRIPITSNDELATLARALNELAAGLQQSIGERECAVEALKESEDQLQKKNQELERQNVMIQEANRLR